MFKKLTTTVRIILGVEFVVNGLNWWIKLITPYPSISDFVHRAPHPGVVGAMIETGFMFHIVKAIEFGAGVALLTNLFVPLALIVVFPVTVNVFLVDFFIATRLRAHLMGSGAMMMNCFLLLAYFEHYRTIMVVRGEPLLFEGTARSKETIPLSAFAYWDTSSLAGPLMKTGGAVCTAIGIVMLSWVSVMIFQRFMGA